MSSQTIQMSAAEVPANLAETIVMQIEDLQKLIDGEIPCSFRLTRAHISVMNRVLAARMANQFDYGEFQVTEDVESEAEIDDDDIIILMNDIMPSPVYHREFYVTTPETSDSERSNAWATFDQFCDEILEQK